MNFDYDYVVIGSGFGGSVSAMRLTQKGYKVAVIEAGKRFEDQDFATTNWNIKKFIWFPKIFCYGIQRINLLNDVMILSGAGVGGGSLVYANTLYIPPEPFFQYATLQEMGGSDIFMPYYNLAQKMLGVVINPHLGPADHWLKETAKDFGQAHTFQPTPVGVYFGDQEQPVDPYFKGEGPLRKGCNECGGCMVGCRYNAKNTLVKNYLYFAEKWGATVIPETKVTQVQPLSSHGEAGYRVLTKTTTHSLGFPKRHFTCKGVVFSAGVLGTLNLLLDHKEKGILPHLSSCLGKTVRTNSEAILGLTAREKGVDYSKGIAITSSVYPDEHSHIEPVRYPKGSDAMGLLATLLTDGGTGLPRPLKYLRNVIRHPVDFLKSAWPLGFAENSVIILFMQTLDNSIQIQRKRHFYWPFSKRLSSCSEKGGKVPSYIPIANEFTKKMAEKMNAIPGSAINEVFLDIPTTAHILGGCCIGVDSEEGVIDLEHQVFGYQNMYVCDGSMIPANLGVNPSLTIVAMSERAMGLIPPKQNQIHYLKAEIEWGTTELLRQFDK